MRETKKERERDGERKSDREIDNQDEKEIEKARVSERQGDKIIAAGFAIVAVNNAHM